MTMATLDAARRNATFSKIILCAAVASAGLIAGRLSIERPLEQTVSAPRRDLTDAEKKIIFAAIAGKLPGVTIATVAWPRMVLLNREGISDYCATVKKSESTIPFYAQLVFSQADPRQSLNRVNFAIIAAPDDPQARYVVGTACLRYGYGTLLPVAP